MFQIRRVARARQLVEHHDVVAGSDEPLHEVRADEARAARDEHLHGGQG
jgi:hypothetical protein